LIGLILGERKARKGRWVFPVVLLLYILVQIVLVFNIKFSLWEIFVEWFSALPLT
jgi:t-SNARE complex subunit (syntaxin)